MGLIFDVIEGCRALEVSPLARQGQFGGLLGTMGGLVHGPAGACWCLDCLTFLRGPFYHRCCGSIHIFRNRFIKECPKNDMGILRMVQGVLINPEVLEDLGRNLNFFAVRSLICPLTMFPDASSTQVNASSCSASRFCSSSVGLLVLQFLFRILGLSYHALQWLAHFALMPISVRSSRGTVVGVPKTT